MAIIQDYASLGQAITNFTHRSDLATSVDYFIQEAQDKINKDIAEANEGNFIRYQEAAFGPFAIAGDGTVAVPSDYMGAKDLQVADGGGSIFTLIMKDPQWIYDNYPVRQPSGLPAYIARDSSSGVELFIFGPFPDSSYNVQGTYYAQAPLLSNSQTTNWMVLKAPMLLHAACMIQAQLFINNAEGLAMWESIYQGRLTNLVNRDKAERWGAATMQIESA